MLTLFCLPGILIKIPQSSCSSQKQEIRVKKTTVFFTQIIDETQSFKPVKQYQATSASRWSISSSIRPYGLTCWYINDVSPRQSS